MSAAVSPGNWDYVAADFNRNGVSDLIGVRMNGTGTGAMDVHVFNGG